MTKAMLARPCFQRTAFKLVNYLKLARLHKPIGIFLLGWPVAWAFWFAYAGFPPIPLLTLFLAGTILMRSAGCVINDIADRNFDHQVQRTKNRPLTKGNLSLAEAWILFFFLLYLAFLILLQLPFVCFYYALVAIFLTALYPFCKRFMRCPQFVLSLAFSMGIPMAFATNQQFFNSTLVVLFLINLCWVIAYDTEYAMADQADDVKVGINSTAIFFGRYVRMTIGILQLASHLLWLVLASPFALADVFAKAITLGIWTMGGLLLLHQQKQLLKSNADAYMKAFVSNHWYGLIMWLFCWQYFSYALD